MLIIDDVQHAAPEVAGLLEALAGQLHEVPVLLVYLARPELRQAQPNWGRTAARCSPGWPPRPAARGAPRTVILTAGCPPSPGTG